MKKPNIVIDPNSTPPSAAVLAEAQKALEGVRKQVSGIALWLLALVALTFFALHLKLVEDNPMVTLLFVVGVMGHIAAHLYEKKVISQRIAEVSPIPPALIQEAALLANASRTAQAYRDEVRKQKRELTLLEFEALRSLAASVPLAEARRALYG